MSKKQKWRWTPRFAVDGGITTGVAWGCFPSPEYGGIAERIARGIKGGGFGFVQVPSVGKFERPEINNVWEANGLIALWAAWNTELEDRGMGLYPTKILLEDFSVGQSGKGVRTRHLLQSARVTSAFESAIMGYVEEGTEWMHVPTFYIPAHTMQYATNQRLKDWGFWIRGMEHVRDATRLIALDMAKEVRKA